ncbi:hypothetical protein [Xylophilus ampelinus]|uniref:Uncharacterized protein n=1 Tax=Xylophilus ampelinus TaxID=54067 RepID=A0A318SL67_9BURK|nr:hypothetical protein [Xylophilus ampelinus]MCS4509119.1 hypothetical protein [Xylophilus ampelinus]PYE79853.1 hypothetical protein DFQ15_101173 [Xylophilus ampelinus]
MTMRLSMDETLHRIGAAMQERNGRPVDQIDQAEDAEDQLARECVEVRLQGYDPKGQREAGEVAAALHQYRRAFELLLGGPRQVLAALRAAQESREMPLEELEPAGRELLRKWAGAAAQLQSEGLGALTTGTAHKAWFSATIVRRRDELAAAARIKAAREAPPPAQSPGQIDLF